MRKKVFLMTLFIVWIIFFECDDAYAKEYLTECQEETSQNCFFLNQLEMRQDMVNKSDYTLNNEYIANDIEVCNKMSLKMDVFTVRIFVDNVLVDTLNCKYGDSISLSNTYKGMTVREWIYSIEYKSDYGSIIQKRVSVIDNSVDIKITGDDDIQGYSAINEPDGDYLTIPSNSPDNKTVNDNSNNVQNDFSTNNCDNTDNSDNTNNSITQKRLSVPRIIKYKRGTSKITFRGKKKTYVFIKLRKKIRTIYLDKKAERTIKLKNKLKKGERIKIYAKKSGYLNSKTCTYKVK